jgi:hypothetical protein
MWVKGTPLHFIVNSGSQKKIISNEFIKRLKLSTMPQPQPHTISWLSQGQDIRTSHQCHLSYNIKPFKDEVLCNVTLLELCGPLLRKPYMWKHHVVYDSRSHSFIVTLRGHIYRVPKLVSTIVVSLVLESSSKRLSLSLEKFSSSWFNQKVNRRSL